MQKNNIYLISIAIFVLVVFVGYLFLDSGEKNISVEENKDEIVENTSSDGEGIAIEIVDENGEIAKENKIISAPVPDLDRPINVPKSALPGAKEETTKKINDIIALLKKDSNLYNEWVDLGILRKEIEDYEGAKEAWEYASAIRPYNSISFGNLGTLYGYYLQNAILAEKNYLKALENDSKLPYLYMQTADFYLEVLNNPEKAQTILERGLKEIPGDEALKSALSNI